MSLPYVVKIKFDKHFALTNEMATAETIVCGLRGIGYGLPDGPEISVSLEANGTADPNTIRTVTGICRRLSDKTRDSR